MRRLAFVICVVGAAAGSQTPFESKMLSVAAFDGRLAVADADALTPSTGLTLEAWVYYDDAAHAGFSTPTVLRKGDAAVAFAIFQNDALLGGAMQFDVNVGGALQSVVSAVPTPLRTWCHVACVHDGVVAKIYLNGVETGSAPAAGALTDVAGPLRIANAQANAPWKGNLDEIRLWSVARSGADIAGRRFDRLDGASALVAAWHFDGDYTDGPGPFVSSPNAGLALVASTSPVRAMIVHAPAYAVAGTTVNYSIQSSFPSTQYLLEISVTGATPGFPLPAPLYGIVPLNRPWVFTELGALLPSSWFSGFVGVTDAFGSAQASLFVPPLAPQLAEIDVVATAFDFVGPFGVGAVGEGKRTVVTGGPASIASVLPQVVPAAGNVVVTVTGTGFVAGTTVKVGTVLATGVQVTSWTSLTFVAPARPPGIYDVLVTVPGSAAAVAPGAFVSTLPIAIATVDPLAAGAGATINVTGDGLFGATATVGGIPATVVSSTPTTLSFIRPLGVNCDANLVVTDPLTGASASRVWNPTPMINSLVFATGPAAGGTLFFINGSSFITGSTVTVGGAPVTSPGIATGNPVCVCTSPPGSPGPALVLVTSPTGCGSPQLVYFTYY